jgi:hypothetical protein
MTFKGTFKVFAVKEYQYKNFKKVQKGLMYKWPGISFISGVKGLVSQT